MGSMWTARCIIWRPRWPGVDFSHSLGPNSFAKTRRTVGQEILGGTFGCSFIFLPAIFLPYPLKSRRAKMPGPCNNPVLTGK